MVCIRETNETQDESVLWGGETSQTIDASYYKGPGARNGKEREIIATEPICMSDRKGHNGITTDGTATTLTAQEKERPIMSDQTSVVRRLTPLECERLQGFPSEKKWDVSQMTKDEYIAWNLAEGNIIAEPRTGKVYTTRGPGGCPYNSPKELVGTELSGYRVVSIRNGTTKLQCRVHRIIWISVHGMIPDGYVIDHINNDKQDNRIENLQLLTAAENSKKAREDGLYKTGLDTKATKLDPDLRDDIAFLYEWTGITQKKLAEIYGVSKSRISQIIHEVGWSKYGKYDGKVKPLSDSARYRLQGNSIARPFWSWLCKRISAQYDNTPTLGGLFSGQGGFELCWEEVNGKGTAKWSSEIEKDAVSVMRMHFGDEETGN